MFVLELFEQPKEADLISAMRDFLPIAVKHLQIKKLPTINLVKELHDTHVPTFGSYSNESQTIKLVAVNRNIVDILRTLAHELVHHKQNELQVLSAGSWHAGSPAEDQAHAEAGVIMRKFDAAYPEWLTTKPITESTNHQNLDSVLVELCNLIVQGMKNDPQDFYGMVAAAVIDPKGNIVLRLNHADGEGKRIHAERVAIDAYKEQLGELPEDCIIVTTLSPCNDPTMDERHGESCTDYINSIGVKRVYCGYTDPTQHDTSKAEFTVTCTDNKKIQNLCKDFADTFLTENYKDGKKPGRKGLAKRMGVDCSKSVTALRKIAKNSSGEKQRMAHWCANMKAGKK